MRYLLLSLFLCGCSNTGITCDLSISRSDYTSALQACVDSSDTVNIPPGEYNISGSISISNRSNLVITSYYPYAVIKANNTNIGPALINIMNSSNVSINNIILDGNKEERRKILKNSDLVSGEGYNALLDGCDYCVVDNIISRNAFQGSGMVITGKGVVVKNSSFISNGYGYDSTHRLMWSDGLTILSSDNAEIYNNYFEDNSDVDLIIGPSVNASLHDNKIVHRSNFSFAAIMIERFSKDQQGNFYGTTVYNNSVDCGDGWCGIGISIGHGYWSTSVPYLEGAEVYDNTILGSRFGILLDNGAATLNNNIVDTRVWTNGVCSTASYLDVGVNDPLNGPACFVNTIPFYY